ncbi:hypothetical protein J0H33_17125 [bacterium]|nr:hypothetical protein [bacterium]
MSGWLLLATYAAVIAPAFAIIAWGVLRRLGRLEARPATLGAMLTWAVLVAAPLVGLAVDSARSDRACPVAQECYEHFFTVIGVPSGWLLALLILVAMTSFGRLAARATSR